MPSSSLHTWRTISAHSLDEIEAAHAAIGGTRRGRRYATQQLNHAYAVLLSSQFQRFFRDLHSEAVDVLATAMPSPALADIFNSQLTSGRKLDFGNPNPGNIGSDFDRLGLKFWPSILASDVRNAARRSMLESLNRWRNAVAHQDFDVALLGKTSLRLSHIRRWRNGCTALAAEFDFVLGQFLARMVGKAPW